MHVLFGRREPRNYYIFAGLTDVREDVLRSAIFRYTVEHKNHSWDLEWLTVRQDV